MIHGLSELATDNKDNTHCKTIFRIMHEFGYSLEEVQLMPIPTYFIIIEFIYEMDRKKIEANKGRKK